MALELWQRIMPILMVPIVAFFLIHPIKIRIPCFGPCRAKRKRWTLPLSLATVPPVCVAFLLACGSINWNDVYVGIVGNADKQPYGIIILFFSLAYMCISLDITGVFEYIALKAIIWSKGSATKLFFAMAILAGVLSVFTSNDIVVLTLTPIIVALTDFAKVDPIPFQMVQFVSSNIWAMTLIVGSPTNIIVAQAAKLDFLSYSKWLTLPAIVAGFSSVFFTWLRFRSRIPGSITPFHIDPFLFIRDRISAIYGFVCLFTCLILLIVAPWLDPLPLWAIPLIFGFLMLLKDIIVDIKVGKIVFESPTDKLNRLLKEDEEKNGKKTDDIGIEETESSEMKDIKKSDSESGGSKQSKPIESKESEKSEKKESSSGSGAASDKVESKERKKEISKRGKTTDKESSQEESPNISKRPPSKIPYAYLDRLKKEKQLEEASSISPSYDSETVDLSDSRSEERKKDSEHKKDDEHFHLVQQGEKEGEIIIGNATEADDVEEEEDVEEKLKKPKFRYHTVEVALRLPWTIAPFIFSIFIIVEALRVAGWTAEISRGIALAITTNDTASSYATSAIVFTAGSAIVAAIMNDQPMTVLFATIVLDPAIATLPRRSFFAAIFSLAAGSNIGPCLTLPGSLAGIMWAAILKSKGRPVKYVEFLLWCLTITPPVILLVAAVFTFETAIFPL